MSRPSEKERGWGGDSNAEWLDLAAEAASIGTWEFDLEEGTGFISERCAEIIGYPKASSGQLVQFTDWLSRLRPEDRKRINLACDPMGEGELKLRLQLLSTGGLVRYVLLRGRCFFTSGHFAGAKPVRKAVRLLGIVRDLSDREFYQRALTDSDRRLRWAVQHAPIPILIHLDDGQVIELNRAWQRLSGYSIEEIPTLSAWATVSWDQPNARNMLQRIYSAGDGSGGVPLETSLRTKNGEVRRWLFYSAALGSMHHGRQARMISAVDLTDQKAAEEERNRAFQQAEAANRSKDQFLATLSHELRTPLNAILGWIFLMKQKSVKPELQKEGLAVIERNARAQSSLIADLLDISRIVAGKLRLEPRLFNFLSCVESAVDNVRPAAKEKAVRLVNQVDAGTLPGIPMMYGDPVRLEQVLLNVLVNAIKFTPPKGSVEVSITVTESLARLNVKDTGIGIAPEFISNLFDRFSQADETLRKDRGLGLGLTISRHIVELHRGKIFAQSDGMGKGALFTIELPITSQKILTLSGRSPPSDYREQAVPTLDRITVVSVDDNADARGFVDQVLKLHGATVISVDSGSKAVAAVLQYHPDVVLCDLMMPEMDGYEVLQHLRALDDEVAKTVPVVALTAFAGAENRLKTQQAGFQIHLDKPIDPPQLIDTIQTLMKSSKSGGR